jgi:hypothetical protein
MKKTIIICSIILSVLLGACSTLYVSSVQTHSTSHFVDSDLSIQVYLGEKYPEYEELGYIQVIVPLYYADNIGNVVRKAKLEAQKMGADCLMLTNKLNLNDDGQRAVFAPEGGAGTTEDALFPHKYIFIAGVIR